MRQWAIYIACLVFVVVVVGSIIRRSDASSPKPDSRPATAKPTGGHRGMTLTAKWTSGGVEYSVVAVQGEFDPDETAEQCKARFDQMVADMKSTYPPDLLKKG